jgi:alkanesulfonate monooxygenase SsuD/methylene tetrahydromethanopterin reductase-like flavin-dependent oxidoreductase (luciferase family)
MRIILGAVILPLHDPVKVAEQIAVLDLISGGRIDTVFGAGYVKYEFDAFGVSLKDRARLLDEGIEIIQRALSGERFRFNDREIFVRPLPIQNPPPLFAAGGVTATAQRAARFGMGLWPLTPKLVPIFDNECRKLGRTPGPVIGHVGSVHVSEDPDATWDELAPYVAHVAKSYADWGSDAASSSSPFHDVTTIEAMKASGLYQIVTPDECVKLAKQLEKTTSGINLTPLMGGLSPKSGWKNLELFIGKVLPRLKSEGPDGA